MWCWLLALAFFASSAVVRCDAQQKLVVSVNETKVVPMPQGKLFLKAEADLPNIVDVVENKADGLKSFLITGLTPGITPLKVFDNQNGVQTFMVEVQTDIQYLSYLIKKTVPTANVVPLPVGRNKVILSGTVVKSEDIPIVLATAQSAVAGEVVNAMRVGGVMQVQLCVVIATVARSELRTMSFSFFNAGQHHYLASALTANNLTSATNIISPAAVTGALATAPGVNNILFGFVNDKQGFFGFLSALRNEGLAKFLAEPRLVTLSGKPASFLSGGRLAVPEPSGLGTNSVRFEDFGTELNFLPIVLGSKIYLEVEPVVNTINQANGTVIQGTAVPGFDTQRLHTSVELEDGQTFVLGGLIQSTVNATTSKVPILGDIPFVNTLFSTKTFNQTESELLIIITPHLVDASTCEQLPKQLPGQETRIPDDFELFLEGIVEAPRGQRQVFPRGHYMAAYKNSPSAGTFPCGYGNGGYGGYGGNGACGAGCSNGSCGCGNGSAPDYQNHGPATPDTLHTPQMVPAAHFTDGAATPGQAVEQTAPQPSDMNPLPAADMPPTAESGPAVGPVGGGQ
jgi:pilus assembly protein CpaC